MKRDSVERIIFLVLIFLCSNLIISTLPVAEGRSLTELFEERFGFTVKDYVEDGKNSGAIVGNVTRGKAADGILKEGDEIIRISGQKINTAQDVIRFLQAFPHQSMNLSLTVHRNGIWVVVPWEISSPLFHSEGHSTSQNIQRKSLGILVRDYVEGGRVDGAIVENVVRGMPAEGVIFPGDIIQEVEGRVIISAQDMINVVKTIPKHLNSVALSIIRNGESKFVLAKLGVPPLGKEDFVRKSIPCLIRTALDKKGNLLYIAPTDYLLQFKKTSIARVWEEIREDGLQMYSSTVGVFQTLDSSKWCQRESPDFIIPVDLLLVGQWDHVFLLLDLVFQDYVGNSRRNTSYVVHNNGGVRGAIVGCTIKRQSRDELNISNDLWLREFYLVAEEYPVTEDLDPDRFFLDFEYGGLISEEENYRKNLSLEALDHLTAKARVMGVEEEGITQAIFDGLFNPHLDDLSLAYEGLKIAEGLTPTFAGLQDCEQPESHSYQLKKAWENRFGGMPHEAIESLEFKFPDVAKDLNRDFTPIEYFEAYNLNFRPKPIHSLYKKNLREEIYLPLRQRLVLNTLRTLTKSTQDIPSKEYPSPPNLPPSQASRSIGGTKTNISQSDLKGNLEKSHDSGIGNSQEPFSSTDKTPVPFDWSRNPTSEQYANNISANSLEAFIFYFVNSGMTLELGDEIFCTIGSLIKKKDSEGVLKSDSFKSCRTRARLKQDYIDNNHPIAGVVGAILGYVLYAPLALFFASRISKETTASGIFVVTFKCEMYEGMVCVLGQIFTNGEVLPALVSFIFGLGSGVIRGGALALLKQGHVDFDLRYKMKLWGAGAFMAAIFFIDIMSKG